MINHTVLWTMKSDLEDKENKINIIKTELLELKNRIPDIITIDVQTNDPKANESNYDIALISTFANLSALNNYQKHPEHQKVGKIIKELVASRAAIDYSFEKRQ